jgi:hypothetical protein
MDRLVLGGRVFAVVRAAAADVPALVRLLADDELGRSRETADLRPYLDAFHEIASDSHQLLVVVKDERGAVVGTMQLTLIPGLARSDFRSRPCAWRPRFAAPGWAQPYWSGPTITGESTARRWPS